MEVDKIPYHDHKDDLDSRSDDSGVKDINENVKDGTEISDDRLKVRGNGKARDEEVDDDDDDDQSLVIDTRVTPSHAGPFIVEKPLANSPIHINTPVATMAHPLPPVMPPKTTKKGTAPIREAVDPAKYIRVQDVDGIKYACSKCGNIYKWRKSLNKHWKEKHDGEIPTPLGPAGYAALNIPHLVGQGLAGLPFSLKSHTQSRMGMKGFPDLGRHGLYSNAMNFEKSHSMKSAFMPSSPSKDTKWGMEGFRRSPVISTPSPKPSSMPPSSEKSFSLPSLPSPAYRQPNIPNEMFNAKKPNMDKGLLTTASPYLLSVPPAAHSKGIKQSATEPCDEAPLDLSRSSSKGDTIIIEENNGEVLNLSRGESLVSAAKLKSSNNFSTDFSKKIESVMNCYLSGGAVQVKQEMPDVYAAGSFGVWQCFKCPYAAKDASDYEQHLASHAGKNSASHRCAECQQTFSSLEVLNDHFGTDHADLVNSYEAGDSDLLSKTRENLQLYRYLTMPKDGTYKCMVCGSVFSWQWDLARHFDKYHQPLPNPYQRQDSMEDEDSADGEPSPKRARLEQDLTCQLCTFQARDREELRRHLLVHSLNKQYACTMCGYSTQWQDDLTQHVKRYHKQDPDSLTDDGDSMAAIYEKKSYLNSLGLRSNDELENENSRASLDLSSHKSVSPSPSKHHNTMYSKKSGRAPNSAEILLPYKCSVCEYRARWPSEITQHMKNHSDEKPFRCPRCTYKSKWKWDVVKHLKRCGGGTVKDVIDTSKGKSSTPTWVKALQFKSSMSGGPPNVTVVPPPGERPNDGDALMPYYRGSEDSQGSASSRSPAQLHCLQCPFISSSPAELKRHSRVHSDDKPFACVTCGYSSKWKCDLKKHLRTYLHIAAPTDISDRSNDEDDDEDDYSGAASPDSQDAEDRAVHKCYKCSFSAPTRSALDSHMKIHSQEKSNKLRCKQCDYEAADLPAFLQHKLVHSQESREMSVEREDSATPTTDTPRHRRKPQKQFCCDKCPYTTFDRSTMETHRECHEATNLDFTCDYCDFSTNDQDVMDDHIRLHPEFFNDMQPQNTGNESDTDVEDDQNVAKTNENDKELPNDKAVDTETNGEESEKEDENEKNDDKNPNEGENHFLVESSHPNSHRQGKGESFQSKDSDGKCDSEENSSENENMTDNSESFSCPKCPFTCSSQSAMLRHFDMHGSDGRFKCDTCDFAVNRMNLLLQHRKIHISNQLKGSYIPVTDLSKDSGTPANRNTSLSCQMCPFVTSSVKALQIHIQMHIMGRNSSSNSPVPFPISRPRSPDHTHEKSKFYYKCNRCPYQTNNRGNFESHKTQHQIRSKLQCPYCDYSSARSAQISSHVRLHFPGNQLESDVLWTLVLAANQTTEVSSSPATSEDPEADDSAHSTESDACLAPTTSIKKSCRYCDRQFPDMLARELHEKQHRVDVSVC